MPHDVISSEALTTPLPEEITEQAHRKPTDILQLMKEAGRALVASTKHLAAKGLVAGLLGASAMSLAPQLAEAQSFANVYSYSNGLAGCVPNDSSGLPCGFADVQFTLNTVTGAFTGTYNGQTITALSTSFPYYLEYVGYQPVGWNGVGFGTDGGGNGSAGTAGGAVASEDGVYLNGYDVGYMVSVGSTTVAYGWSSLPGTWAVGGVYNPKTLGGATTPQTQPGNEVTLVSPFVPGGPSPGTTTSICRPGVVMCGDPVNVATGGLFEQVEDYKTAGPNPLGFSRYYNNLGTGAPTFATSLGLNWRSTYDRYLRFGIDYSGAITSLAAERADGQELAFTLVGSVWTADTDVDVRLSNSGSTWTLKDHDDDVETYTVGGNGTKGVLQSTKARNGYTQTLAYNANGQVQTVTDSYSRVLHFTYTGNLLNTMTTPDGQTFTYGYASSGTNAISPSTLDLLSSVAYSTSPVTSQIYTYGDSNLPLSLTSVTDENGNVYSSWTYNDLTNQVASSQRGSGANLTSFAYNSDGTVTVSNAFGVEDTYTFTTYQGVPKVTAISRAATSTTAAATESFGYDSNGYTNSVIDWNGNHTTYINNAYGEPTTINEAVGSSVARTTTISYDPTWVRLPHQTVTSGLTSTFAYDTSGNPLTRTDLDTTTNTVPYSTNGQSRVTTWTWSTTGEETSVRLPRTDVTAKTTYTFGSDGALTQVADALSHLTKITAHTGGGLPQTIVDQNSVTTTLAYDARLNLHTSTLATTAGNLVTTYTHDPANQLTAVQLPDNSKLTYGYDTAHRLKSVTDLLSNSINYTLDDLGDKTLTQVKNPSGTVTASHSGTFDALGRMLTDVGGMTQTTTFTWDKNGNALTIAPPSPSGTITQTWDALNRLATRVDPSPGGTTTLTYDTHDRALTLKDANLNTTTNVYDGFGDRTQLTSPDSGVTTYHYDADRNTSQSVKAGSLTANMTYDALDRSLATTYPSDTTLNVARTYDQSGHGFGVGRLTSVTDQVGSLSNTFDERGNITGESRVITSVGTLATATTYDNANRVSGVAYPSGSMVAYVHNTIGQVSSVTAKAPGATSSTNVATSITYEPFGPVTGLTFGNGIVGTYAYDADYRPTTRIDKNGTTSISNLAYTYYNNDSVHVVTDSVTAVNTQTLVYDSMDRLTSGVSGTGGYGTYGYTWDKVSNVATQVINGTTTTYNLTSGTNKLSSIVSGSTTETVASTAAGNINTITSGGTALDTLTYNQANELATATSTTSTASYKYGFTGERLEKTYPGTNPVVYQYGQAARELLSENDLHSGQVADYIYLNGSPIGEINPANGKFYATHTDRLGTPQKLTDSSKALAWTASYAPFGNTTSFSGTLTNQSVRLPGQYFDPETQMNHNGFRDYSGSLTRYAESDPIGLTAGTNTYQYALANPLKYTDREGLNSGETSFLSGVAAGSRSYFSNVGDSVSFLAAGVGLNGDIAQQQANTTEIVTRTLAIKAFDLYVNNSTVRDCLNHAIWNFATENPGFVVGRVGTGLAASIIGGPGVGLPLTGIAIIGAGVGEVGSGVKDPETFLKRLVKGGINDGPK